MKLTVKDAEFLAKLRQLLEEKDLAIELKDAGYKYFVLRKNYGDRIETHFGMTRQGVRWRFQRLFNDIYASAYATILCIESNFGSDLRRQALEVAKQRAQRMRETADVNRSVKLRQR